ncbi:uncharacterized protein [Epargyreus clarus]|uniref:uncharacterized protein n=1 Tax=Epargyreus clarus TaxID=520877 RepID=UPI003C2B9EAD
MASALDSLQIKINVFCYTCLNRTRELHPVGDHYDTLKVILADKVLIKDGVKVCWECRGMLRRVKEFQKRCFVSQNTLCRQWARGSVPQALSSVDYGPIRINDVVLKKEDTYVHKVLKDAPIPGNLDCYDTKYFNGLKIEREFEPYMWMSDDMHTVDFWEVNMCEDTIDPIEEASEIILDETNNDDNVQPNNDNLNNSGQPDNDNFNNDDLNNDNLNNSVQPDNNHLNNDDLNNDNLNNSVQPDNDDLNNDNLNNSVQPNNDILNNDTSEIMNMLKENKMSRARMRKEDLEGHYKMVDITRNDLKSFRIKIKFDASELITWRNHARASDFYQKQPYKCHDCVFGFLNLKDKKEHDEKYHNEAVGKWKCDICLMHFASKDLLEAHVVKHYYVYKCLVCGRRYESRRVVKLHMKRHKQALRCAHCAACFPNINAFYKHFKTNHSFVCDHCGKKSRTKYTLEKHMKHHFVPNVCLICNKQYASRNSLRNHCELKHKSTCRELAYCVPCDKQFANAALYKRHVTGSAAHAAERDAGGDKKQFSCPICNNMYSRKTYMMNHYRHVHMKQSKHYCADCDRHFLNRTRYVEHRKYQHEGKTKLKNKLCNICGRGFSANRTLVNHIRTHSGERPYGCAHCDARFTQKHGMVSHVKYIHMKGKRRAF